MSLNTRSVFAILAAFTLVPVLATTGCAQLAQHLQNVRRILGRRGGRNIHHMENQRGFLHLAQRL